MAINQNHLFEDLDGVKCAIVEKNVSKDRVEFLRQVLSYNHYTVIAVLSPPPKATTALIAASAGAAGDAPEPVLPETYTVGVTDVAFNPTNAIFGRLLTLPGGHIVTRAFWFQQETISHDDQPYFE